MCYQRIRGQGSLASRRSAKTPSIVFSESCQEQLPHHRCGRSPKRRIDRASSAARGRLPGEYGKIAYVTTDGGTASPLPDGI
jgi:hypothetical protein